MKRSFSVSWFSLDHYLYDIKKSFDITPGFE
jgi:hypothetical protein